MRRLLMGFFCAFLLAAPAGAAQNPARIVEDADIILQSFVDGRYGGNVKNLLRGSKAVIILPSYYRAGFVVGAAGGQGVIIARDEHGDWTYPGFVTVGGASVGLQIGASASELVIFIQSEKSLYQVLNTRLRLGGQAGVTVATIGGEIGGMKGLSSNTDFVVLARSVGLYGGINLEGATMEERPDLAQRYYGQPLSLKDILVEQRAVNEAAEGLRKTLRGAQ